MVDVNPREGSPASARRSDNCTTSLVRPGFPQSTVSRVLNAASSSIPISEETRERVLASARRLGYSPNPLARGLRGAPTMLLGVIVRDITDPFFAGPIEAISIEAARRGYNVVLGHAHSRADEAMVLRSALETRRVDAILVLGDMTDQPRFIDDLRNCRVPVVTLWQGTALHGLPMVNVDNATGAGISLSADDFEQIGATIERSSALLEPDRRHVEPAQGHPGDRLGVARIVLAPRAAATVAPGELGRDSLAGRRSATRWRAAAAP